MDYLKIQNKGILNTQLISLMGGSTKTGDENKIGEYGTGLKYAITYFLREGIKFKLFIGGKEIVFCVKETTVKGKLFQKVMIGSRVTDITLNYGVGWKAWEAIREIWCNAIDEKAGTREIVTVENDRWDVKAGHTTFFIECTEEIQNVINEWDKHFIAEGEPLFENENVAIYDNKGQHLKLYKRGILIHTSEYRKSLFRYDLKKAPLNELREYKGNAEGDVATAILNSSREIIKILLASYKNKDDNWFSDSKPFEHYLNYSYGSYKKEEVKELFSGYFFLTPTSDTKGMTERMVKVNDNLLAVLKDCDLPTETIYSSYGGYGTSGSYSGLAYRIVKEDKLLTRLQTLIEKHEKEKKINLQIGVVVSTSSDFDFTKAEKGGYVVNSKLDMLNNTDLEVIALMIISDAKQGNNLYNIAKRLVKMSLKHKSLKSILFGK